MSYREVDAELLRDAKIFPLLQQLITDCNNISSKSVRSTSFARDPLQEAKDKTQDKGREKKAQQIRDRKIIEENEEADRQKKLRLSSWTAFRLIATR